MTDLTDNDLRHARQWADGISSSRILNENARAAVRVILATVDAPAHTLAEELARIAENSPVWTIQNVCDELKSAAARAEQVEQDRDRLAVDRENQEKALTEHGRLLSRARAEVERLTAELDYLDNGLAAVIDRCNAEEKAKREAIQQRDEARAEVERLTAERLDRNPETKARVEEALNNLDQVEKVAVQKGAESNAETPDPADVKPGEAWIVECRGERRNAVKDNGIDIPWNTINADGWYLSEDNAGITLVSRLVPAPRAITNPDEIEALPHRTVIRDNAGVMFQRIVHGWYQAGDTSVHRSDDNFICLPATVLWEPGA